MSSDIVIRVENLSKKYTLGHRPNGPDSGLRHALQHAATAPWRMWKNRKPKDENGVSAFDFPLSALPPDSPPPLSTSNFQLSTLAPNADDFWALRDVSFEIKRGEILGIIGRNGAGKSTLLKILSRITEPTSGRIGIKGRVASLLEVGTGFHPELTGRENIFLNGAILGMSRADIKRKFDEIVDFAEVEKFLDTPVKRYSSGMYVRLAFAVAAHLDPEILIIDEVLAVGDAAFQRKCLGKMQDVSTKQGRTVIFVSHNIPMVQSLCDRGILLTEGRLEAVSGIEAAVGRYLAINTPVSSGIVDATTLVHSPVAIENIIRRVWLEDADGNVTNSVCMGACLTICFAFEVPRALHDAGFGFGIENSHQARLVSFNNYLLNRTPISVRGGGLARCTISTMPLLPGHYTCSISVVSGRSQWIDYIERVISFDVLPFDVYSTGTIPESSQGIFWTNAKVEVITPDT